MAGRASNCRSPSAQSTGRRIENLSQPLGVIRVLVGKDRAALFAHALPLLLRFDARFATENELRGRRRKIERFEFRQRKLKEARHIPQGLRGFQDAFRSQARGERERDPGEPILRRGYGLWFGCVHG